MNCERYWQVYNCELTTNQAYQGNTSIYLPLVRDAVEARVVRYTNMLFPENEQHVDVVSHPGDMPHGLMALLNHYVKTSHLRHLTPALIRNGEVEGHYGIYWDWSETERYVTKKSVKMSQIQISLDDGAEESIDNPDDTYTDVDDETITQSTPTIDLIPLADLAVIPATADMVEDAEAVVRILRLTKEGIKKAERDGLFTAKGCKRLLKMFPVGDPPAMQSIEKKKVEAAGVKDGGKYALIYEAWTRWKIDGKRRWVRLFFGGEDGKGPLVLGFTVNPNWNDRCSIISVPRTKVSGSHYGKSPVDAVEQLQYQANDAVNMGMDSAQYSLCPIVKTDPQKNPNYASLVMAIAAVWPTAPDDTEIITFPQLWKDAMGIVESCKSQIMQSFGLNPAMMPMGAPGKKPSQAQVSQEQMVALENTANEVTTLEEALFSPLLHAFFEMDQQHRDAPLAVRVYGQMGIAAQMEEVPPFAWDDRYEFRWRGVQVMRSAQQNQQMIAFLNILKSLPPVLPDGKRIDISPIVETITENVCGPRLGARVLVDLRDQLMVEPEQENDYMAGGVDMPVHFMDDDAKHLQTHMQASKMTGDPTGLLRAHSAKHAAQLGQKQQAQQGQGKPGAPGGGGQPGAAGTPRAGAQPGQPRMQGPPGSIHQDQMQDPGRMPRLARG